MVLKKQKSLLNVNRAILYYGKEKKMFEDLRSLLVGFSDEKSFDTDLKLYLGNVIGILTQLGVFTEDFKIDENASWEEVMNSTTKPDSNAFEMVKVFIIHKMKILFDPPTGTGADFIKSSLAEQEWRIREKYGSDYQPLVKEVDHYDIWG